MPTFDLVVVGAGGGPDETNLSAYLVKPCGTSWKDGVVALEAGSGQGALSQILSRHPRIFATPAREASPGVEAEDVYSAAEIFSFIDCYLISHAHLDHINSLIISAGSLRGPRKRIYAAEQTLQDLETIFSDRIWPNLASWKETDEDHKLLYSPLPFDRKYHRVSPHLSVRMMPLSHGTAAGDGAPYTSSAFFIRHDASAREFLFFGDVEPDALAHVPQTLDVWRDAAPKIPTHLATLFIECSWPAERPDDMLYGHLSPPHLVAELRALAAEVVKARAAAHPARKKQRREGAAAAVDLTGALAGLTVYIIHCKDDLSRRPGSLPLSQRILQQARDLAAPHSLGVEILIAEQGMRLEF